MSTIYLLRKEQPNGVSYLTLVTREQWLSVIRRERNRFFIRDCIFDCGHMDCMVIETTEEEYQKWNQERMASIRNYRIGQDIQKISLDEYVQNVDGLVPLRDVIEADNRTEELAIDSIQLKAIRQALAGWRFWGVDILDLYLAGEQKACVSIMMKKYGVTPQTARKYKRQFENFIKKFLLSVSFSS